VEELDGRRLARVRVEPLEVNADLLSEFPSPLPE